MAVRTVIQVVACALGLFFAGSAPAQPPEGAGTPKTPAEVFRAARDQIQDGRFDVAADTLKAFLALQPKDEDLLALMAREPTVFQRLRNIPVWSEDPKAQADALKTVDEIIKRSEEANRKVHRNADRITKYVKNLGATEEERLYAEDQLIKGGDAVVPILVEFLRTSSDVSTRSGIYGCVSKLGPETIPGLLASFEGLSEESRLGILRGFTARQDVLSLFTTAETDFTPHLWYYASASGDQATELRKFSVQTLERLGATPSRRLADQELLKLAVPFTNKTARYRFGDRVKLWSWDGTKVNSLDATRDQADEFYGIRILKWANERNPNSTATQELFLSFAIQRAIEKAKFGDLATSDPTLYQVAASAPSNLLIKLLDGALTGQKTALALGLAQILGARADRAAVSGPNLNSTGVLVKALDYADPRVQLAAAIAVLRSPVQSHGKHAKIVDILQKAVGADAGNGATPEMGRALISDPVGVRAARVSQYLQQMGFATERFASGRDLLRRAAKSSDYDLVILDRSTSDPELKDVLAQLRPVGSGAKLPILVMASSGKPRAIPLESLMLRLAKLIAVTETAGIEVPSPFTFDPTKPVPDLEAARRKANTVRDYQIAELHKIRNERMIRIVTAAGLPVLPEVTERLKIRSSQLTYAVLSAEYGLSATSAPETFAQYKLLNDQIAEKKDFHSAQELPLELLSKIIEQLDAALDEPRRKQFDILTTRVLTDHLHLPDDAVRDTDLEERLSRQLRTFPAVSVIPEPYSLVGFSEEVRSAAADPAQLPRDASEKKQSALVAVQWLRKLALGEIPGFDVTPAETSLRAALRNDALGEAATDCVSKIASAPAQQDLATVAITATRPAPLRIKAAERAVQHIQAYGKLIPANLQDAIAKAAEGEQNLELKGKLLILSNLLSGKSSDLGKLIGSFPVPVPQPPKPAGDPMPKEAEKKD